MGRGRRRRWGQCGGTEWEYERKSVTKLFMEEGDDYWMMDDGMACEHNIWSQFRMWICERVAVLLE